MGEQTGSPKEFDRNLAHEERAHGAVRLSVAAAQEFIDADQEGDWEHKEMLKMQNGPSNSLENQGEFRREFHPTWEAYENRTNA